MLAQTGLTPKTSSAWPRSMPVVVLDDVDDAVPLARALVARRPAGDRGDAAHAAGARRRSSASPTRSPGSLVGAGTITTARHVDDALDAGARFLVSPGATPTLLRRDAGQRPAVPARHGDRRRTCSPLLERGITYAKFFPAEVDGGVKALKAFAGPFPQMRFCPTGGIDVAKAPEYLALPNVGCVGGSWMAKPGDWDAVESLARAAASL